MMRRDVKVARWVLSAPLLAFLAVAVAYPLLYGIRTALQHRTLLDPVATWAGLDNLSHVVRDAGFWHAVLFTLQFTVIVTLVELVLGFALALLMEKAFPGRRGLLSVLILPVMIAPALMGVMFRLLLNQDIGFVPALLHKVGLDITLFSNGAVVPLLTVLDIAQWTPFTFLLFYSGLQTVPRELYEAATVDGASYLRTVQSIVVPLMLPIVFITGFLRAIDGYRTFDVIYVLTGGGPADKTTTLSIYIYKAFATGNFGTASAAALLAALIVLPLVPFVVKRIVTTEPGA
ncbi:carbohydrate ABC transporter permease [Actinopolymorpha pittospori]|uniref:Multiple sugar transport system permease protein n=1 Tax=Actinopolymorpha pittospori TaxID=648752 RepID=A0A927MYN3_9ACTN|nr:sugar ABC transporter permease [Actinopolymorpha pittospori]MBE1607138.1 multiple sugar transport system permease protein [Actinopolymorpha pittospori]